MLASPANHTQLKATRREIAIPEAGPFWPPFELPGSCRPQHCYLNVSLQYKDIPSSGRTSTCLRTSWASRSRRSLWRCKINGHAAEIAGGHCLPQGNLTLPSWCPGSKTSTTAQLSEEELQYYDDPSFGTETRLLQQTGICPTLLHSYGNVFQRCPCGCRQAAFHPDRLQRGGVCGCYIISSVTGQPRFLHTAEASFLCTVPIQYQFPGDARDGLCLVGQIAAPLQAQWMCLHLVRAVQLHYDWVPRCIPQDHIKKTKLDLLWQRHHLWTTESSHATRHIWIKDQWGNNLHILREGQQDVADLLRAEARLADPHYQLWDGSRRVPHDAVLQDQGQHGPYTLIVTTVPDDDREVEIIFYTNTTVTSATLPLGTYLFQACAAGHLTRRHPTSRPAGTRHPARHPALVQHQQATFRRSRRFR